MTSLTTTTASSRSGGRQMSTWGETKNSNRPSPGYLYPLDKAIYLHYYYANTFSSSINWPDLRLPRVPLKDPTLYCSKNHFAFDNATCKVCVFRLKVKIKVTIIQFICACGRCAKTTHCVCPSYGQLKLLLCFLVGFCMYTPLVFYKNYFKPFDI